MVSKRAVWLTRLAAATTVGLMLVANAAVLATHTSRRTPTASSVAASLRAQPRSEVPSAPTVQLASSQLATFKVEPVSTYLFPVDKLAIGSIDFDEDRAVQVFAPYQGKIIAAFADTAALFQALGGGWWRGR